MLLHGLPPAVLGPAALQQQLVWQLFVPPLLLKLQSEGLHGPGSMAFFLLVEKRCCKKSLKSLNACQGCSARSVHVVWLFDYKVAVNLNRINSCIASRCEMLVAQLFSKKLTVQYIDPSLFPQTWLRTT